MDSSILAVGFKMSVALGAVLLVFGAAVYIAKKFFAKGLTRLSKKDSALSKANLQIEASRMLGQGKHLHLVRFGGKVLLVGATTNNISLISEMDIDEDSDGDLSFSSKLERNQEDSKENSFKDQIGNRLREIARV